MATAMITKSCVAAKAAVVAKTPNTARLAKLGQADVAAEWTRKTVSNGSRVNQMMVWHPQDNKYFETLSFLPPLSDDQIAKQVDYITNNGWTPCLEFANANQAYVASVNTIRMGPVSSGYEDNRYWTMFKLPMFGCTDSSQVLAEVANCAKLFPDAYIRLVAFDAVRQVQVTGFLVHRPPGATDFRAPKERSI